MVQFDLLPFLRATPGTSPAFQTRGGELFEVVLSQG